MSSKTSEYVKKAHNKQLERGYRRLGLRLPPLAHMDLEREMIRTGKCATQVITELLEKTRPQ